MKKSTKIFNVVALIYVSVCLVSTLILSIFLGDEFLAYVKDGMTITVKDGGVVVVE